MFLVTGGAGFIGSNLVRALELRGAGEILVCDRLGQGDKWRNIAKRGIADLVTPEQLPRALAGLRGRITRVFHLGAISSTTVRDADRVVEDNIRASLDLWRWCAAEGVPFLYASSAATYGDGGAGFSDDDSPEHLARLKPLNLYGWSKHMVDRAFLAEVRRGRPAPPIWAGLKFFNVYGPNEYHKDEMMSMAAKMLPALADGLPARLFRSHRAGIPDGGQMRDFVWVGDCVDVMLWLADRPGTAGLFNLGTGQARSFLDLARACFAAVGRREQIQWFDMPDDVRDQYQYFTQAEMGRLTAAGWNRPFLSIEEGVRRYWTDHLGTSDRYA